MASGSLTGGDFEIDPSLHRYGRIDSTLPIDPALFELEGLVNDVRRGKVRLDEPMEEEQDVMDEHDIDPALREIVNSLTNAQQSTAAGQNLTAAQAAAAISAHIADHEDGVRLQQSIEEITSANFGLLNNYPTSPNPYTLSQHDDPEMGDNGHGDSLSEKRGRGRPKGSKNKPKLNPKPKPPKPPKPPSKPRGRPLKPRTQEELEMFESKKADRAMGIKRKKGRPRKYPGYLVRDMRLRKNRAEYLELIRRTEQGLPIDHIQIHGEEEEEENNEEDNVNVEHLAGIEGDMGVMENDVEQDIEYPWPTDDQALLDVVGAARDMVGDGGVELGEEGDVNHTENSIRQVFGLHPIHR